MVIGFVCSICIVWLFKAILQSHKINIAHLMFSVDVLVAAVYIHLYLNEFMSFNLV